MDHGGDRSHRHSAECTANRMVFRALRYHEYLLDIPQPGDPGIRPSEPLWNLSAAVRVGVLELAIKQDKQCQTHLLNEGVSTMRQVNTDWEYVDQVCKELGIPILSADHPIYSEGPSIMFVHHRPEQSAQKDTNSPRKSSPKDSD